MRKKKLITNCVIVTIICFFISLMPIFVFFLDSSDTEFTYNNFNVTATVNEDGSLSMHEEFNINTDDKHTYIREIFYNKDSRSNYDVSNQSSFDFSSFQVSVRKSNGELISATPDNPLNANRGTKYTDCIAFNGDYDELGDKVVCDSSSCAKVIIYLEEGIKDETTYILDYKILNAVNVFNDVAEINWKFVPALDTGKYNVNLTINLPNNNYTLAEDQESGDIHYYGYGGVNSSFIKEECNNTKLVAHSNKLSINEEMEILCYFPSDMITSHGEYNYFNENGEEKILQRINTNLEYEREYANQHNTFLTISLVVCIGFIIIVILLFKRVYKKYDKELVSSFDNEFYRELPANYPPAEMGYLYNEEMVSSNDFSATLLDLIRQKYITIDQNGCSLNDPRPNYKFIYNRNKDQKGLRDYEKYLLYWYFDIMANGRNEITLNDIDNYLSYESTAKKYDECNKIWNEKVFLRGSQNEFFDKTVQKQALKYSSVPSIAILISSVCFFGIILYDIWYVSIFIAIMLSLSVCFFIYCKQVRRRTALGNEDYVRWKAFKHFLEEFSTFEDYPLPGIVVWEHYLVYATSFGIADLVEKQLRLKFSELGRINEFNNTIFYYPSFNYYICYRVNNFNIIGKQTIATAEAQRMASSSRSGGHGGFGGGSSFGGGGGSSGVR